MLGTIGIDNMTGHFRYSFDIPKLGTIGMVPVAVGLFGLAEVALGECEVALAGYAERVYAEDPSGH